MFEVSSLHADGFQFTRVFIHLQTAHYHNHQLNTWLTFVEISKVKAFVELTLSLSVRTGAQSLLAVSLRWVLGW